MHFKLILLRYDDEFHKSHLDFAIVTRIQLKYLIPLYQIILFRQSMHINHLI